MWVQGPATLLGFSPISLPTWPGGAWSAFAELQQFEAALAALPHGSCWGGSLLLPRALGANPHLLELRQAHPDPAQPKEMCGALEQQCWPCSRSRVFLGSAHGSPAAAALLHSELLSFTGLFLHHCWHCC